MWFNKVVHANAAAHIHSQVSIPNVLLSHTVTFRLGMYRTNRMWPSI